MGTVRKTITLTEQQDAWIKAEIAAGRFTNDSEVIRDAVRKAQAPALRSTINTEPVEIVEDPWLAAEIQKGLDSGPSHMTFDEIIAEAAAEYSAKNAR